MRLLIVEDEYDLRSILEKRLKKDFSIDSCSDGESALDYINVYTYDVILLDIMLPKIDGLSVLKKIRARGLDTPVILLTAKSSVSDRVEGLDSGADDYLVKPFAYEELQARLRVILRRNIPAKSNILKVGDLSMDIAAKKVMRGDKVIELTGKEYKILEYMMYNAGSILTRSQLEDRVWDNSFEGGSNIVDVYMRYLRKKVDDDFEHKMIQTVRGMGYRLLTDE